MKHSRKIIASLLFISLICVQFSLQQAVQSINANTATQNGQQQVVQFKELSEPPVIDFKQTHFAYNPQINDEYSIVDTVIYPQKQGSTKFVSSVPKDNFVKKLTDKTPSNDKKVDAKQEPKALQVKKTEEKQKQAEQKAADILKKQTIEQQAKIEEQKRIKQKIQPNTPKQTQTPLAPSKPDNKKPQPIVPNQQSKKTQQPKAVQATQKQPQKNVQPVPKSQQKPQLVQQDLFTSSQAKDHPQIEKTDNTIKFKQHEVAKPLQITNYPFETINEIKNTQVETKQTQKIPVQEKKKETPIRQKQLQNLQKQTMQQPQVQKVKQPQTAKKVEPLPVQPKQQIIATDTPKQLPPKNDKTQKTPQNPKVSQPEAKKSSQHQLNPQLIDQFNKITKALQFDPALLKKQLRFENIIKEQLEQSDWKLLIAKMIIWTSILIAIYQATCSSQSQQKKVQKGKYSPSEDNLEMTERVDQK